MTKKHALPSSLGCPMQASAPLGIFCHVTLPRWCAFLPVCSRLAGGPATVSPTARTRTLEPLSPAEGASSNPAGRGGGPCRRCRCPSSEPCRLDGGDLTWFLFYVPALLRDAASAGKRSEIVTKRISQPSCQVQTTDASVRQLWHHQDRAENGRKWQACLSTLGGQ